MGNNEEAEDGIVEVLIEVGGSIESICQWWMTADGGQVAKSEFARLK